MIRSTAMTFSSPIGWSSLQTDLSTPLAFFLDNPQFRKQTDSTLGLLDANKNKQSAGIYMLEPFDPIAYLL